MASYRRYVATHGAARARALRQVRLHEWETFGDTETYGPVQRSGRRAVTEVPLATDLFPVAAAVAGLRSPEQSFQEYMRSLTQTGVTVEVNPPAAFFDSLAELGKTLSAVRIPAPAFTQPELPVIAYRGRRSGALRCSSCTGSFLLTDELTSEDLPDGGMCSVCDRDLLIVSGAHCSICKHAPHGGEAGCHCGCRGQR